MKYPDPEKIASDLLQQSGQTNPPVDLDRIASIWPGVKIYIDDLEHEGYIVDLGALGAEIVIRSADTHQRQRYTIAHELGHWVLWTNGLSPLHHVPTGIGPSGTEPNIAVERWCDKFAAALLMPRDWIIRDLRDAKLAGLIDRVVSLPDCYAVSSAALNLRISEITPLSIFEIKQWDGQLIVEKRYETKKITAKRIAKTVDSILPTLLDTASPIKSINPETRLLSIYVVQKNDAGKRKWIMCVLPPPLAREQLAEDQIRLNQPRLNSHA